MGKIFLYRKQKWENFLLIQRENCQKNILKLKNSQETFSPLKREKNLENYRANSNPMFHKKWIASNCLCHCKHRKCWALCITLSFNPSTFDFLIFLMKIGKMLDKTGINKQSNRIWSCKDNIQDSVIIASLRYAITLFIWRTGDKENILVFPVTNIIQIKKRSKCRDLSIVISSNTVMSPCSDLLSPILLAKCHSALLKTQQSMYLQCT